jgi:hypothetical protein
LFDQNLLPTTQPFNTAPWQYMGNETADFANASLTNIVDWLLLELRSAADINVVLAQQAVLLQNDGTLIDATGSADICLDPIADNESYYIVLRARHHMAIVSANALTIPTATSYDFSMGANILYPTSQAFMIAPDTYALWAGDMNADGIISVTDFNVYGMFSGDINTYTPADLNCDGFVTTGDFNYYTPNSSLIGLDIIRY